VEFGSSSELDCVVSARSPSPIRLAYAHRNVPGNRVRLSWGSCSPRNAFTSGAPARPDGRGHPGRRRLPHLRRCRPQGSCPSRRFRLRTRHDTNPCGARRLPWHPDASRPYYMPLASLWSCPTELSLPEEPFPLSRDFASLRVRFRLPPARRDRALHGRFPRRASSLPVARPEANRDARAVTTFSRDR